MNKDDFYAAKVIEAEGWEYIDNNDDGAMVFVKSIGGIAYVADVREDK